MSSHPPAPRRAGFTLIEMMVVLGIIAILLTIVTVSIRGVRRSALATACQSNLRQLSAAHAAYGNLYNECFADAGMPHGGAGNPAASFINTLKPFYGDPTVMRSPLDLSQHWDPELGGEGIPVTSGTPPLYRRSSYGLNNYLSRNYSPKAAIEGPGSAADRLGRVNRPSECVAFLLMAETGAYAAADHPHAEEWGPAPEPAVVASTQVAIGAIDRGRPSSASESNWAYVDGHVVPDRFERVFTSAAANQFDPDLH